MPDILVLYDVDGWAYHSRALALAQYAPEDFRVRIAATDALEAHAEPPAATDAALTRWRRYHPHRSGPSAAEWELHRALGDSPPDLVFALCPRRARRLRRVFEERRWATRLVVSWNSGWPRRLEEFEALRGLTDAMIVNNRDYWIRSGCPPHTYPISNGVDLDTFTPVQPPGGRTPRVLWCGSEHHRQIKGYDEFIQPLFARLQATGIACDALLVDSRGPARRDRRAMLDWYNSGTVLVCASESEGTPNPALEAAACGCTIVTTRVGNMPELISDGVNGVFVERDLDSLERGVRCAIANYVPMATRLLADIQSWQWPRRAPAFFSVFQDMLARAGRTGGADDFRDSGKVISTAMPVSEPPPPNTTRA